MTAAALTFCDISCLYAPTGGGIRTYQQAKLRWFAAQSRHRYVFIYPGERSMCERLTPLVKLVQIRGVRAASGYRLPANLPSIAAWVRRIAPDILETGDPWLGGPLGLLARKRGHTRLVSSFFHGNPIDTYARPWATRGYLRGLRHGLLPTMDRSFFRVQRMYDVTVTASRWVASLLEDRGVRHVLRSPFGTDAAFLMAGAQRLSAGARGGSRLLYAGRLQNDKGVDVLLAALPRLLRETDASITIAGIGPAHDAFAQLEGPRVRLHGFVTGRQEMADLFAAHDVLLAPGPFETFGLSALEALAAGLIVVGPDHGGTAELLGQLPGAPVFRAGDVDDFVRATASAVQHARPDLRRAGHDLAREYGTWDDAISRGVENYCSCLSRFTT